MQSNVSVGQFVASDMDNSKESKLENLKWENINSTEIFNRSLLTEKMRITALNINVQLKIY